MRRVFLLVLVVGAAALALWLLTSDPAGTSESLPTQDDPSSQAPSPQLTGTAAPARSTPTVPQPPAQTPPSRPPDTEDRSRASSAGMQRPVAVELRWVGEGTPPAFNAPVQVSVAVSRDLPGPAVARNAWGHLVETTDQVEIGWDYVEVIPFRSFGTRYIDLAAREVPWTEAGEAWLHGGSTSHRAPVQLRIRKDLPKGAAPPQLVISVPELTGLLVSVAPAETQMGNELCMVWVWAIEPATGAPLHHCWPVQSAKPGAVPTLQDPRFIRTDSPRGDGQTPMVAPILLPGEGTFLVVASSASLPTIGHALDLTESVVVDVKAGQIARVGPLQWQRATGVLQGRIRVAGSPAGWHIGAQPAATGQLLKMGTFGVGGLRWQPGQPPVFEPRRGARHQMLTDASGRFRFESLAPLLHRIEVRAPKGTATCLHPKADAPVSWEARPGQGELLLDLAVSRFRIETTVAVPDGDWPPWVRITAMGGDPELPPGVAWNTTPFSLGDTQHVVVSPGMRYYVTIGDHRFEEVGIEVVAPSAGETKTVTLSLTPKRKRADLYVTLTGAGADKIRNVAWGLWPPDKDARQMTPVFFGISNRSDGRFRIPEIGAGTWRLHVRPGAVAFHGASAGWRELVMPVEVAGSQDVELRAKAVPAPRMLLQVLDADGRPAEAQVTAVSPTGATVPLTWRGADPEGGTIVAQGRLPGTPLAEALAALDAGTWKLTLRLEGHRTIERSVTLETGRKQIVEIRMERE